MSVSTAELRERIRRRCRMRRMLFDALLGLGIICLGVLDSRLYFGI
jgi:hypothetical protein